MADENFKIGIDLSVDDDSLADVTKQVERALEEALESKLGKAGTRPQLPATTGAQTRSAGAATSVTSKTFADAVSKAITREIAGVTSSFEDSTQRIIRELEKLNRSIEGLKNIPSPALPAGPPAPPRLGPGDVPQRDPHQFVKDQSSKGPPGSAREIIRAALNRQTEAGRAKGGVGGAPAVRQDTGTTGDPGTDSLKRQQALLQRQIARDPRAAAQMGGHQKAAETQAISVAHALDKLLMSMKNVGALGQIPDLAKLVGMPTGKDVRVGEGASVEVRTQTGLVKTLSTYVRIINKDVADAGNIMVQRVNDIIEHPTWAITVEQAERAARAGDPAGAANILRRRLGTLAQDPALKSTAAQTKFARGGEATVDWEITDPGMLAELNKRRGDEAAQIAYLNKVANETPAILKRLADALGADIITSVGVTEEKAAEAKVTFDEFGNAIARLKVQTRDIGGLGPGGAGGIRYRRAPQTMRALPLERGERPQSGEGIKETIAYATGMFTQAISKNIQTAILDPAKTPEVHEDMILITKKAAAEFGTWISGQSKALATLDPEMGAGKKLRQGDVMGYDIQGKSIEFDLHGVEGEIEAIEEIIDNGIQGWRVHFKEFSDLITGEKLTTPGGFKGVTRVVDEPDLSRYGAPKGTQIAISAPGEARREILADPMRMMASELARVVSDLKGIDIDPQRILEGLEEAMDRGGYTFHEAVRAAAEELDIAADFTGGKGGALTGGMDWYRLKAPQQQGPAEMGKKYYDRPAMKALEMEAGTHAFAKKMQEDMSVVAESLRELTITLQVLGGVADAASMALREMLPESFARIPADYSSLRELAKTLLDPAFTEAMKVPIPKRGGGEEMLRIPSKGRALGERGQFESPLGAIAPNDITRRFDQILETSKQIRAAEGKIPGDVRGDPEMAEAAYYQVKTQVNQALEAALEGGPEALAKFVADMMPLIEQIESFSDDIEYYPSQSAKEAGRGAPGGGFRRGMAPADYVRAQAEGKGGLRNAAYAARDIVAGRPPGTTGMNVPTAGEIQNVEVLQKAMEHLNISIVRTPEYIDELYDRLEHLTEGLKRMLNALVPGSNRDDPMKRRAVEQLSGGVATAPTELTAVQYRSDVSANIAEARKQLELLGRTGQDVTQQLAALDRVQAAQGDVPMIPQDMIWMNQQDWDNLVNTLKEEHKVSTEEAEAMVQGPGLVHRYPTTWGGSFYPAKAGVAPEEAGLPPGKIGIPGPMAGDPNDINMVRDALKGWVSTLVATIASGKVAGEQLKLLSEYVRASYSTLQQLNQVYRLHATNLDFDGDKITYLANAAIAAGQGIETFIQTLEKGAISWEAIAANISGQIKSGGAGSAEEYGKMFEGFQGREAKLAPWTPERAGEEAAAHTGGKKTVGLFTDMFNRMANVATYGTEKVGDTFNTHLKKTMLNINKSLARKGGGEVVDPREFIEDLRQGNLGGMFQKMDRGQGIYGEMSQYNKDYRDDAKIGLESLYGGAGGGAAGEAELRRFGAKEGIQIPEGSITAENLDSVIQQIIDQIDLKAFIKRLYDGLLNSTKTALGAEGLVGAQIDDAIAQMMKSRSEGGAGGLDLTRVATQLEPAWSLSRGAAEKEFGKQDVDTQTRQSLKLLTSGAAAVSGDELSTTVENSFFAIGAELSEALEGGDPRVLATAASAAATAWVKQIEGTYKVLTDEMVIRANLPKGTRGLYQKGPEGKEGEGKIYLREGLIKNYEDAAATLKRVGEGAAISHRELKVLAVDLFALANVKAHEGVHQLNKILTEPKEGLKRELKLGFRGQGAFAGEMGKNQGVRVAMRSRTNVGDKETAWMEADKAVRAVSASARKLGKDAGESKAQIEAFLKTDEAYINLQNKAREAKEAYLDSLVEELLAYQTNMAEYNKMLDAGNVGQLARGALTRAFDDLLSKAARDPNVGTSLVQEPMQTSQQLAALVKSMGDASLSEDPEYRKERRDLTGFDETRGAVDNRKLIEIAISKGLSSWGIKAAEKVGGMYQKRDVGNLEYGTGEHADAEIERLNTEYRALFDQLEAGTTSITQLQKQAGGVFARIRDRYKELEAGGDVNAGTSYKMVEKRLVEWRAAIMERMLNDAKGIEKAIIAAEASGAATSAPHELEELLKKYAAKMEEIRKFSRGTTRMIGPGEGHAASPVMTPQGVPIEEAIQANAGPGIEGLQDRIKEIAGRGAEGAEFMQRFEKGIMEAVGAILKGEKATVVWQSLLEMLAQEPKNIHTNLVKVVQILGKATSETAAWESGKYSEAANGLRTTAKWANELSKALDGVPIENWSDVVMQARTLGSARQQTAVEKGRSGEGRGPSVGAQYEEAYQQGAKYKKQLEEIIKSEGYRQAGSPKHFEPIEYKIIDPDSGKVLQVLRIEAKRTGDVITTSMTQAGAAAGATSNQIRSALRRVVQWGFASGIVYGLVRAFRNVIQVVTEVQTKIANLQKVMNTATTNFDKMRTQASDFASEFGIAIEEVLDGMVVYAQQGLEMAEINDRTRATLLAVNVTTLSATEATEALTAAHKVFSSAISESTHFVDAWANVAAHNAITAKDLALAVQKSGAAAMTAGVNFEDFMGIVTAIGAVTRQTGKEIGTSARFMFRAMRRPTAQKQLLRLGVQSQTAGGDLKPAMDVLGDLAGKWDTLSRAQKLNTAQAMAGIRHYNSFIILMDNWRQALDASADAQNSSGFATRKNAFAMATLNKQVQKMQEEFKKVAIDVGKAMLPIATWGIQSVSKLVDLFGMLPDAMKTAFVVGGGLMVGFTKAADMAVDTWEAVSGSAVSAQYGDSGSKTIGAGVRKAASVTGGAMLHPLAAAGQIGGGIKSFFQGIKGAATAGAEWGKLSQAFGTTAKEIELLKKLQAASMTKDLGEGAGWAAKKVYGLASSFGRLSTLSKGFVVGGGAVMLAAMAGLAIIWATLPKKGKEVEATLEGQIGAAMSTAEAFDEQAKSSASLGTELHRISKLQEKMASGEEINLMFKEDSFKGPHTAALKLRDAMAGVANSLALIDPTAVSGIDEAGDYILKIGSGFENIAYSAADAQKAVAAALQTKIIKSFTQELTEPASVLAKIKQLLGDFGIDVGPSTTMGEYEEITDSLKEAHAKRNELLRLGKSTISQDQIINTLTEKRNETMAELVEKAKEIKRTFEEMPVFKDMGLAARQLEAPGLASGVDLAVETGQFGRGATEASVMLKQLAKSGGTGGMFSYEAGGSPQRMAENFLQKGIGPQVTGGEQGGLFDIVKQTGDIVQVSESVAKSLLELGGAIGGLSEEDLSEAIEGLRHGVAEIDKGTGKAIVRFWDAAHNKFVEMGAEAYQVITAALGEQGTQAAVFLKTQMEAAAADTERILTLAFAGAMAGIRQPANVDIGPARWSDVGSRERMLGSLPEEMQRFSDIAKQLSDHASKFNENMSAEGLGEVSQQLNALDETALEMIMNLQQEGFKLSAAAHFNEALQDMHKSLENTAIAVKKLAATEDERARVAKHASGALAGLAVMPKLEFGQSAKELTGLERIQKRRPEVAGVVQRAALAQGTQKLMEDAAVEMRGKMEDAKTMIEDLMARGEKLTEEQVKVKRSMQSRGLSKEAQEYVTALIATKDALEGIGNRQLDVQTKILDVLSLQAQMSMAETPEEKRKIYTEAVGGKPFEELATALGKAGAGIDMDQLRRELTGIDKTGETEFKSAGRLGIPFNEREGFVAMGRSESFGAVNPSVGDELTGSAKELFERTRDRMIEIEEMVTALSKYQAQRTSGLMGWSQDEDAASPGVTQELAKYGEEMDTLMKSLLTIPEIREEAAKRTRLAASGFGPDGSPIEGAPETPEQAGQRAMESWMQTLLNAEGVMDGLRDATAMAADQANQALSPLEISQNIENFAKSIDDTIDDFKKAEALFYTKVKSDLEGAFARVGQPGFKTTFEQRREEVENRSGGRRTMQQMKDDSAELAKIDFDEKEAKIKEKQDVETAALRDQQSQAETIRTKIADALYSGQLEGSPETANMAKRYMDTLTDQLAESEQATMQGDKLTFKGVPALENVKNFASQLKKESEEKALEAENQRLADINKKSITTPILEKLSELIRYLSGIEENTQTQLAADGTLATGAVPSATSAAAASGTPAAVTGLPGAAPITPAVAAAAPTISADERAQLEALGMPVPGPLGSGSAPITPAVAAAAPTISADERAQLEALGMPIPGPLGPGAIGPGTAGPAGGTTVISQAQIEAVALARRHSTTQSGMLSDMGSMAPRQIMPMSDADREAKIKARTAEFQAQMAEGATHDGRQFVTEQTIGPSPRSIQEKDDWYQKRLTEDMLKGGLTSYAPSGANKGATSFSDRNVDPAYKDANAAFQRVKEAPGPITLPTVGILSNTMEAERQARRDSGNATATPNPPTTVDASGEQVNRDGTQARRDAQATGRTDQTSSTGNEEVVKKLDIISKGVESLNSVVTAAVGGGVKVNNLGEVTSALDSSLSGVGADITDLQTLVAQLGTIVDINGLPLDARDELLQAQIDLAKSDVDTQFTNLSEELSEQAAEAGLTAAQEQVAALEATLTILKDALDDTVAAGTASTGEVDALKASVAVTAQQIEATEERLGLTEAAAAEAREIGREAGIQAVAAAEKAEQAAALEDRIKAIEDAQAVVETEREEFRDATGALLEAQDEVAQLRREFNENNREKGISDREREESIRMIQAAEAEVRALKEEQERQLRELNEAKLGLKQAQKDAKRADENAKEALNKARQK